MNPTQPTPNDALFRAAKEALLVLAVLKIQIKIEPYKELTSQLQQEIFTAHDHLFEALMEEKEHGSKD